jgi:phage gpG-like protein
MTTLSFKPWGPFTAIKDKNAVREFLHDAGEKSLKAFRKGMSGPHSGRTYIRSGGRSHRASAAGEFPAIDSGALFANVSTNVNDERMVIGSSRPYSGFLAYGTSRMSARKMSIDALQEGTRGLKFPRHFVVFKQGGK